VYPGDTVNAVVFEDLSFHCVTVDPEMVIEVASAASTHNATFDEIVSGVTGTIGVYCTTGLIYVGETPSMVVALMV
jgi:hypothetical protein